MGQLINPLSFRLNNNKFWMIRWSTFLKTSFKYILKDDFLIFSFLNFLFYKLKKLLKKKYFFLIIDFMILKKNNLYFFLIDYLFLNKFYKKYFKNKKYKKLKKNTYIKNKLNKITSKILIFNIIKILNKKKITLKKKSYLFSKFKLKLYRIIKKIKIKKLKRMKSKTLIKNLLVIKKNLLVSRNFFKSFFILFFFKNFNFNYVYIILNFLIIYKKKINFFFVNNPFFIFKFIKTFLILNLKKFLKNNLNLKISYRFIIKLKNIENIFQIRKKINKNLIVKDFLKNFNFLNKNNLNDNIKKNKIIFYNILKFLKKNKIIKKKKPLKKKIYIKDFFFLELPKQKKNYGREFFFKRNKLFNKKRYLKNIVLNNFIKNLFKKKKYLTNKLIIKKKFKYIMNKKNSIFIIFNFNLKIFSIFFKFLFKKYRYNTNKILRLLENNLTNFIKLRTFIKGFKIKIKGRFTQKSRSSLSIKNIGKYSLSKISNKIIYFEENISTIYGISSFKLFFLVDNNFFNKKKILSKILFKNF